MLQPNIIDVIPLENYMLELHYENGEKKIFDVKPYIKGEWYGKLKDLSIFKTVKVVDNWTVEWDGGQDISPNELYKHSIKVED